MEIDKSSYKKIHRKVGEYIHRYYLPKQYQDEIQPRDVASLYEEFIRMTFEDETPDLTRTTMLEGPCIIRYRREHLVKEIPSALMPCLFEACMAYRLDKRPYNLSDEDSRFLISLNDRVRILEHELRCECNRLNREYHTRINEGALFLEDYEIDVTLYLMLRREHPLLQKNDDPVLYEFNPAGFGTVRPDAWDEHIREEQASATMDFNDLRNSDHPLIRGTSLFQIPHCHLFHELSAHSPVPLKHLCGIDSISCAIEIQHQGDFLVG